MSQWTVILFFGASCWKPACEETERVQKSRSLVLREAEEMKLMGSWRERGMLEVVSGEEVRGMEETRLVQRTRMGRRIIMIAVGTCGLLVARFVG